MAKKEATLLLKVVSKGAQKTFGMVGKFFKEMPKKMKNFGKSLVKDFAQRFVITAGDVVQAVQKIAKVTVEYIGKASDFKDVQESFRQMAASQGQDADMLLEKMRALSKGTVSDLNLMKQANTALMLGLPVDRFGEILNIARSASKSTGESMDFMLNSIVTGLGRGSKLMLDNLGIVFDVGKAYEEYAKKLGRTAESLTDAEKKQAFINKALEVGSRNADAAGNSALSSKEKWQQFTVQLDNLATLLAESFLPLIDKMTPILKEWAQGFKEMTVDKTKGDIVDLQFALQQLQGDLKAAEGKNFFSKFLNMEATTEGVRTEADKIRAEIKRVEEAIAQSGAKQAELNEKKNKAIAAQNEAARLERQQKEAEERQRKEAERLDALEKEIEWIGLSEEQRAEAELDAKIQANEKKLAQETDFEKRRTLLHQREELLRAKAQQKIDAIKLKNREDTFNTIKTLQNSNNKALATAGKAFAIRQIALDTPVAISKAMSAFPPPVNFVLAGLVAAAMAKQAAAVAGVQLAEGGIVMPTPGGTRATIGEAGRAEAVVPLPEDFDPDSPNIGSGTINVNFNGPVMGSPEEARQFIRMIDKGIFELRQRNESINFDAGSF